MKCADKAVLGSSLEAALKLTREPVLEGRGRGDTPLPASLIKLQVGCVPVEQAGLAHLAVLVLVVDATAMQASLNSPYAQYGL